MRMLVTVHCAVYIVLLTSTKTANEVLDSIIVIIMVGLTLDSAHVRPVLAVL